MDTAYRYTHALSAFFYERISPPPPPNDQREGDDAYHEDALFQGHNDPPTGANLSVSFPHAVQPGADSRANNSRYGP